MEGLDTRFVSERMEATETVCDICRETILESEERYQVVDFIICEHCSRDDFHRLSVRLTHKYRTGYSDLDEWEDIGAYKVLSEGSEQTSDHDGSVNTAMIVDVYSNGADDVIKKALLNAFDRGCCCEHDCCGCQFGSADFVTKIDNDEDGIRSGWVVKASYRINC